jgi:ubiquinone/menaquinone biosynthesis C-methylase UbiE
VQVYLKTLVKRVCDRTQKCQRCLNEESTLTHILRALRSNAKLTSILDFLQYLSTGLDGFFELLWCMAKGHEMRRILLISLLGSMGCAHRGHHALAHEHETHGHHDQADAYGPHGIENKAHACKHSGHHNKPAQTNDGGHHKNPHAQASHGHHQHRFENAVKWAKRFEDKNRDEWQKPDLVINTLGIQKGDRIADIGSATGYFPVRLAKVATEGKVWGVDVEPDMVRYLNERARREKIPHLFSVLGTADDPLIPEKVNWILMVNTYHHIENRIAYFQKLKGYLASGGKVVIIDFKKKELPLGPPVAMKIAKEGIVEQVQAAGYSLVADEDILPHQNMLVFE